MSDRITNKDLEQLCRILNGRALGDPDVQLWRRLTDLEEAPINVATIGAYYIDGAYGGVALYRIMSEGGGVTDVFSCGHVTKRDLYNRIRAYLDGIDVADKEAREYA